MMRIIIIFFMFGLFAVQSEEVQDNTLELVDFQPMIEKLTLMKDIKRKQEDVILRSQHLKFNRLDGLIKLTGSASIEQENAILTGEQITVLLHEEVRLVCEPNAFLELESVFDNTEKTDIRAGKIIFHNKNNLIECSGTVRIRDQKGALNSQYLDLSFKESNELDWLHAHSNVIMQMSDYLISSDNMYFLTDQRKIELSGQSRLMESKNVLSADSIDLWPDSKRILCKPNVQMILFPDHQSWRAVQKELNTSE